MNITWSDTDASDNNNDDDDDDNNNNNNNDNNNDVITPRNTITAVHKAPHNYANNDAPRIVLASTMSIIKARCYEAT